MLSTADFQLVRDLVRTRSGIVLDDEKAYLAEARLRQLARTVGADSPETVVAQVRAGRDAALVTKVVEAMTTNETSFFRDGHPFEAMQSTIVPELMRKRAAEKKLTIWCAASSTGQEPYSTVMTLREHFPALASWTVRFLATDLSTEVLDRARAGRYTQMEIGRGMPQHLLEKYFDRDGTGYVVRDALRKAVEFRQYNLLSEALPINGVDILFMRNVLIYFDPPTKYAILDRAKAAMKPDGYLFLGGTETTWNLHDGFARVPCGRAHYYRPLNIGPNARVKSA